MCSCGTTEEQEYIGQAAANKIVGEMGMPGEDTPCQTSIYLDKPSFNEKPSFSFQPNGLVTPVGGPPGFSSSTTLYTTEPVAAVASTPKGEVNTSITAAQASDVQAIENEKMRLQVLVREFAQDAVSGISVSVVDPATTRIERCVFKIDRYLTLCTIRPEPDAKSVSSVEFGVKDLAGVCRAAEVAQLRPDFGEIAQCCIGVEMALDVGRVFFYFEDDKERERFYTCLKILRLSSDIKRQQNR